MLSNITFLCEGDISRIRRHAPNGAIVLRFGMQGVIADVITHANFLSIGSGVLEFCPPPKFYYLHRIGWSILQQRKHYRATL